MYRDIVKPWIASQSTERIQWVYNILDKKKEADTILYEQQGSNGFIVSTNTPLDELI
jgi:m7GpppX diphosphatase